MNDANNADDNVTRIPPKGGPFWDNYVDRRLDAITGQVKDVQGRLKEVLEQLSSGMRDLRAQERVSDKQINDLGRLEERLKNTQRDLDETSKRLERLAPLDWLVRIDTKLSEILDDNKSPFVRKNEFKSEIDPLKRAVFLAISTICVIVIGAVVRYAMK